MSFVQSIHLLLQCSIHWCNGLSAVAMFHLPLQCSVCRCNVSAAPSTALHCNTTHPLPLQRNMALFHCNTFSSSMQHNSVSHCNTCLPPLQCNWVSHCNTLIPLQCSASTGKYCCTLCAIYPPAIAMFSSCCNTSLIATQLGLPFQHSHPPLQHSCCNALSFPQVEGQLTIDIRAGCHILG